MDLEAKADKDGGDEYLDMETKKKRRKLKLVCRACFKLQKPTEPSIAWLFIGSFESGLEKVWYSYCPRCGHSIAAAIVAAEAMLRRCLQR